jgi:hypothetical protein
MIGSKPPSVHRQALIAKRNARNERDGGQHKQRNDQYAEERESHRLI